MKRMLMLAGMAMVAIAPPALAGERRVERPPVVVSPDLSAPWVMQLGRTPGTIVPRRLKTTAAAEERSRRRVEALLGGADTMRTASVRAPASRDIRPAIDPKYLPQQVAWDGGQEPGTIIIDTNQNFLFLVEANGMARRYGVGTGKPGFEWAGEHRITGKREWPDWRPPPEMIERERASGRALPAFMPGGPENPLGARALYIGSTLYRIHGTNQPWTIGGRVSSGCIRLRNEDVVDLYERVRVGAKVIVI
jgi:lipoprotein-anchoring transpeptidase ErfK/SrfK